MEGGEGVGEIAECPGGLCADREGGRVESMEYTGVTVQQEAHVLREVCECDGENTMGVADLLPTNSCT